MKPSGRPSTERARGPSRRGVVWAIGLLLLGTAMAAIWLAQTDGGPDRDATEAYFGGGVEPSSPPCVPSSSSAAPRPLDAHVPLSLFRGPGVTDADVARLARPAQAYLGPLGIRLTTRSAALPIPEEALFTQRAVDLELHGDGSDPDAVMDALLAPTRGLLSRMAQPRQPRIHVVVLPRIATPDAAIGRALPHLTGITFGSENTQGRGSASARLHRQLGLEGGFTPTIVLALREIDALPAGTVPTTLAHELGHALGLAHVEDPHNLMSAEPHRCRPTLTEAQLQAIEGRASALR